MSLNPYEYKKCAILSKSRSNSSFISLLYIDDLRRNSFLEVVGT